MDVQIFPDQFFVSDLVGIKHGPHKGLYGRVHRVRGEEVLVGGFKGVKIWIHQGQLELARRGVH